LELRGAGVRWSAGAVGLLAATAGVLEFSNAGDEDAEIAILAGRDATP
jgi:hypothetical protein